MTKVIYVGQDLSYFETIKKRLPEIAQQDEEIEFLVYWPKDLNRFHQLCATIVHELPNIAFLDYSSHPQKVMTLARSLPRLLDRGPALIGLWDHYVKEELFLEGLTLGIPFTHFKSPEISDLINQALFLHNGGPFPEGVFAKAEIMKKPLKLEASSLFRAGFLTEEYIHVEHDFLPPENKEFTLKHQLKNFPIKFYKTLRRIDKDYYYEMAYCSDYSYVHFPSAKLVNAEDFKHKGNFSFKNAQYEEIEQSKEIAQSKELVRGFIKKSVGRNSPKKTRLLVIDEDLNIIRQAPRPLDDYPYSIRFYRSFKKRENLLRRICPGIIVYQCPEESTGEIDDIVNEVKSTEGFNPFIFIFQAKMSSDELQEHYQYSQIIAWKEAFNFKQMISFCETYEEHLGRGKSHQKGNSRPNDEERFYVAKDSRESFLEYNFDIFLKSICEAWAKFESVEEFAIWSQIRLEAPVPFMMTVVEKEKEGDRFHYRGIIHGIGELERADLRRAVNNYIYQEMQ